MTEHTIELAVPPAELRDWRQRKEDQEFFDRGERIVLVDGVRWGRTRVTWHGCNGTRTAIEQDGDDVIGRYTRGGRFVAEDVRSASPRNAKQFIKGEYRLPDNWKGTEELVLDKLRELINTGKLRDPAIVRVEQAERSRLREAQHRDAQVRENTAFRQRAAEAVRANDLNSEIVDRIVEAMRWAQTQ